MLVKTFLRSLLCCFPEVIRTEQSGSVLFVPNS